MLESSCLYWQARGQDPSPGHPAAQPTAHPAWTQRLSPSVHRRMTPLPRGLRGPLRLSPSPAAPIGAGIYPPPWAWSPQGACWPTAPWSGCCPPIAVCPGDFAPEEEEVSECLLSTFSSLSLSCTHCPGQTQQSLPEASEGPWDSSFPGADRDDAA